MDQAIVVSDQYITPVADVQNALIRYQAMKDFVQQILKKDVDFGAIPGTDKPTLLKPGAEKLASFFGLSHVFEIVEKELDWTGAHHGGEPLFYFHYRCRVMRGDLAFEGEGSANSWEKKHRFRWVGEADVPPGLDKTRLKTRDGRVSEFAFAVEKGETSGQYGKPEEYWKRFRDAIANGTATKITKKARSGREMDAWEIGSPLYCIPNEDVADLVNTLQKMAQKRAYVAAVLLAVNGSEYFTQDVEDYIDGEYHIVNDPKPEQKQEQKPAPPPPPTRSAEEIIEDMGYDPEPPKSNGKGNKPAPARPYDPETLKTGLTAKAAKLAADRTPDPKHVQEIAASLDTIVGGEDKRHELMRWLWGSDSTKDLNYGQVMAMVQWLKPAYDKDTKQFTYDALAATEARSAHTHSLKANGQTELPME